MSLKRQELKKYWKMFIENYPPGSMEFRIIRYIKGLVIGVFLLYLILLRFPFLLGNEVLQSALVVLLFTFPLVTANWLIKNSDASQQLEDSLKQQNETLFSNSLQLLFKENDIIANSVGLKELVQLKQERKINSERIDLITSSGLQIKEARLQEANLKGANLPMANLKGANLPIANLQGANLQKANLQKADLLVANLKGANLPIANLQGADLKWANLQGAYLQGANLQGANLQGANLQGANLQGANLQGANLQGAELEHSIYDEKTLFPDKFDPEQYGMRKVKLT